MIILNADLDNTIIYSYKYDIGIKKIGVESYQGREISYITERTYALLKELNKKMLIVPTSTRTVEQYRRIDLKAGAFRYALVCNGGILLVDGKAEEKWYKESLEMIHESVPVLHKAWVLLKADPRRMFELRFIEGLFLFTKCNEPEIVVKELREQLDVSLVDIFHNGAKVYVVPVRLSKGNAVERFKKYVNADMVIAAGDSEFDISMLKAADIGLAPFGFTQKYGIGFHVKEAGEQEQFSEYVLSCCREIANAAIRGSGVSGS